MTKYLETKKNSIEEAISSVVLGEKITKKELDRLEDQNEHGLLALKLAQAYGTPAEVKTIKDINKRHISIKVVLNILKRKNNTKFGLMFGPEASGLSNKDLSLSNFILTIPTTQKFKSINLSHSVTIICYEIFKALNPIKFSKKGRSLKISSKSKQSSFVKYLISLLEQKDFFLPEEKKQSMILSINNLVYRLEPNDKELRILASIVSSLSKN